MRISSIRLCFLLLLAVAIIPACGGGSGGSSSQPAQNPWHGSTTIQVTVTAPVGVSTQGWSLHSGLGGSAGASGSVAQVQGDLASNQMVWVTDSSGNIALMGMRLGGEATIAVDTASTSLALIFLSPFIDFETADAPAIRSQVMLLQETKDLSMEIGASLVAAAAPLLSLPSIKSAVQKATDASIQALYSSPKSMKVEVTPATAQSGLLVEKDRYTLGGSLTMKITNKKSRWVHAFAEYDGSPVEIGNVLISSAETLQFAPPLIGAPQVERLSMPADFDPKKVAIKCYGPGWVSPPGFSSDPQRDRLNLPACATIIDNFFIRKFSLILGFKGFLSQSGPGSGKDKLLKLLLRGLSSATKDLLAQGDLLLAVFEVMHAGFLAMATNQDGVLTQALAEIGADGLVNLAMSTLGKFATVPGLVWQGVQLAALLYDLINTVYDFKTSEVFVKFDVKNAPPAITLTATPRCGASPLTVNFSISSPVAILQCRWAFDATSSPVTYDLTTPSSTLRHQYSYDGPGSRSFTAQVEATDEDGAVATATCQIKVGQSITVTPSNLVQTSTGLTTSYDTWPGTQFGASGGEAPYSWSISDGMAGEVDASTGIYKVLRNMATANVIATDSAGCVGQGAVTVTTSDMLFQTDQVPGLMTLSFTGNLLTPAGPFLDGDGNPTPGAWMYLVSAPLGDYDLTISNSNPDIARYYNVSFWHYFNRRTFVFPSNGGSSLSTSGFVPPGGSVSLSVRRVQE